ncbi:hypothetical protein G6N82_10410 [Altererythrobacter sp. BO-6]|uniref:RNA-directed DNA polymerase n=1 Tax=Altererythrobacter sp. BO-6 TaxID=2604537 RepID=UPI0013E1EE0B|nr:RNA-directed DNA polymerase [Altererythrobacter sp. BO-6]QIG54508.1 hypothetical protein G6N82_10410 [Altererythrobacter sp. BO-6]
MINPVSYYLLSSFIAENWSNITKAYNLSSCSGVRPAFPALAAPGRAIGTATLAAKRKRQQHLASVYPVILSLDLNRFYGSIYTHSIPWAVLGKEKAKALYRARTLRGDWSNTLDVLVRGCNQAQTIGIAIGPDTSRIVSEIILSRIDAELTAPGSGLASTQIFHAIDDYQFGVLSTYEAEGAESQFVRVIGRYGLRLNDFKTSVQHGLDFAPSNFQRSFDSLDGRHEHFVEQFFEVLYHLAKKHQNSNVIGYALKKFARVLSSHSQQETVQEYLQRLLYAAPHQARFILPLLLGIYKRDGVSADTNRLIKWGVDVCSRRNDVGNLLWFLYSAIFLRTKVGAAQCAQCIGVANELVDLVLYHGRSEGLFSVSLAAMRSRYKQSGLDTSAWLPLYEIERHGWDTSPAFTKIGTVDDEDNHYELLRNEGVEFYLTGIQHFSVSAFDGWNLTDDDFQVRDWDRAGLQELLWTDGRDWENYD